MKWRPDEEPAAFEPWPHATHGKGSDRATNLGALKRLRRTSSSGRRHRHRPRPVALRRVPARLWRLLDGGELGEEPRP